MNAGGGFLFEGPGGPYPGRPQGDDGPGEAKSPDDPGSSLRPAGIGSNADTPGSAHLTDYLRALGDQIIALHGHAHPLADEWVGIAAQVADFAFDVPPPQVLHVPSRDIDQRTPWRPRLLAAPTAPVCINRVVRLGMERIAAQSPQITLIVGDSYFDLSDPRIQYVLLIFEVRDLAIQAIPASAQVGACLALAQQIVAHLFLPGV